MIDSIFKQCGDLTPTRRRPETRTSTDRSNRKQRADRSKANGPRGQVVVIRPIVTEVEQVKDTCSEKVVTGLNNNVMSCCVYINYTCTRVCVRVWIFFLSDFSNKMRPVGNVQKTDPVGGSTVIDNSRGSSKVIGCPV